MTSQQTSFRDVYQFPPTGKSINTLKQSTSKRLFRQVQPKQENFFTIVQKAKHVALFTQKIKQKVAENQTFQNNTLKEKQVCFLQNQSQGLVEEVYFSHDNKFLLGFDVLFCIMIISYCWSCTYQIIFGSKSHHQLISISGLVVYLIHILLFNMTELKDKKQDIISNKKQIFDYYIKQKAIRDTVFLISILITYAQVQQSTRPIFIIVRIITLVCYGEVNAVFKKIQNQFEISIQTQIVISVLKLLYKIFIFLHFLSLFLNLVAILQTNSGQTNTWLTSEKNNLNYDNNFQKYIIGWYWSATILSTVGFGQIVPVNNLERFLVSIIQILCCMTIGYFVNTIGSLIKLHNQPEQKYQKQLRSLNRCLNNMNPTIQLKHKIRNHYFNMHVIQSTHNVNQQSQVMQKLTPQIKNGLIQENNMLFLQKCRDLTKFSKQTLTKFTHKLKKIILAPQSILYSRNKKQFKLWFIKNGTVEQYTDGFIDSKIKKIISIYNQKDPVLGFINFFTQTIYKTMAKTKQFVLLYELDQQSFLQTLKQNIKQYYKFLTIKQCLFQKNKRYTSKCLSCDRFTHNVINCPRIHFVKKDARKLIIKNRNLNKFIQEDLQFRKKNNRSLIRLNWKTMQNRKLIKNQSQNISDNESFLKTTQNGPGIQNLFNFVSRGTLRDIQKPIISKNSFCLQKKMSQYKLDVKDILNNIESFKQLLSQDDKQFNEPFDRILLNDQTHEYMPLHNINEILLCYNKKSKKQAQKKQDPKKPKSKLEKSR